MRAARPEPLEPLLRAGERDGRGPAADATHRRAVHRLPVLRQPADDGVADPAGRGGQPQTGASGPRGPWGGRQAWLTQQGESVNRKRVQRLLRVMGLEAIYPKPRLSAPGRVHRIDPYL